MDSRIAQVKKIAGATPARMDEGNSVGLGGLHRVSDVLASSSWLVDVLLAGAEAGLAGFNVHSWDGYGYPANGYAPRSGSVSYYTPFVVRGGLVVSRPLLYGLALLRDIGGQRFCRTDVTGSAGAHVKAWALRKASTGHLSVYLTNKSSGGDAAMVEIAIPDGYSAAAGVSRIGDPGGCGGTRPSINGSRVPGNGGYTWQPIVMPTEVAGRSVQVQLSSCESALLDISPVGGPAG